MEYRMRDLLAYAKTIERLEPELRSAFDIAFRNPTDAAVVAFEAFEAADRLEELCALIETAEELGIVNAERLDRLRLEWEHAAAPGCEEVR